MLDRPPLRKQTRRPVWAGFLALVIGLTASAVPVAAVPGQEPKPQPPPTKPAPPGGGEEEETGPKKPTKPVPPVEEGPPAKPPGQNPTPPGTPAPGTPGTPKPPGTAPTPPEQEEGDKDKGVYLAKLDDVARAAAAATDPAVKQYLAGFAVAYDRLDDSNFRTYRITPVPLLWGKDKFPADFGIAPLGADNAPGEVQSVSVKKVRSITPFELIAVEKTTEFLKPDPPGPNAPKPADKLAAAERVMTAVMFFHDSARDQNRRRGKSWDAVKAAVYDKLTEVRVGRVKQAAADKDWAKVKELSGRLAALYKDNPKVLEPVYAARLAEAEELVKSDKVTDMEKGRELLNEYEGRFPEIPNGPPRSGAEVARRVRAALKARAAKFIEDAQRQMATDKSAAQNILRNVEVIDPDNQGLRKMQQELRSGYQVLIVGTRRMPERMSPATARFDSERQAVELMFEGLFEALPDEQFGVRFRPALAASWPTVGAGVRDVQLVRSAEWAGADGNRVFAASDVAGTLRLLRQKPGSWAADLASWYDEPRFDPGDPGRVQVRFKLGHPDPRQLLTLKLQPADWLLTKNKAIDDIEFARHPFGTGPYRLSPDYRPIAPGEPPRDVVFVANPAYARRPGRMAQPAIKEVRFTDVTQYPDLPAEFRGGRLHVLTDVPTPDLPKYTADGNLGGKVRVVTAAANRRIYLLAINHRRPHLQNPDVRKGLSHAIDRERVLNEVYRGGQTDFHKALTGPFPVNSWATPRSHAPAGLYSRDAAQAEFRRYLATPGAVRQLSLLYPNDDPQAKAACDRIKGMVESATSGDDRKLTIVPEGVPPRELLRRVEEQPQYDLAYLPFDYPDDWYPLGLGSFLDPSPAATAPGGRNYLGYLSKESNPGEADDRLARTLAECRLHTDFAKLSTLAADAHRQFNEAVPFVPLWQLDRHMVIATAVKVHLAGQVEEAQPRLLNPTTLFSSIGSWRVE